MTGRIIEDDLFGICARLKSIDGGYYVFLDYKTGRFELHHGVGAHSLCLVLPFDRLDERTVRHVLYTRAERVKELVAAMERENAKLENEQNRRAADRAFAAFENGVV